MLKLTRRQIVYTLFKRKKAFFGFFLSVLLLTAAYIIFVPWTYKSYAAIFVMIDKDNLADANLQQRATQPVQANQNTAGYIIASHVDMLLSEDVARATINKLGVQYVYPGLVANPPRFFGTPFEAAVDRLQNKDLYVEVDKTSNTLLVSLKNHDPAVAQKTLQTVIASFAELEAQLLHNPRAEFMKRQLDAAHTSLTALQSAYLQYRLQEGVFTPSDETAELLKQRNDIEESISQTKAKVVSDRAGMEQLLRSKLITSSQIAISNENDQVLRQLDAARAKLEAAEQGYLEASQTYKSDNPLLVDAQNLLGLARQHYQDILNSSTSRIRSGPNPIYQELESQLKVTGTDLAASQAALETWENERKLVQARLEHINKVESNINNYGFQITAEAANYEAYLSRSEEARISDDLNRHGMFGIGITQQPSLPYEPWPKISLIVIIAIFLGLVGGIGLCFALESADETMGLPAQVEQRTGLRVLATLNRTANHTGFLAA
jgi:uncharacterized protein involved in exopolysaccharide biosynthesis